MGKVSSVLGRVLMGRKSEFADYVDPRKGTPGNYVLNQKVQKFADRRTKRNRDRASVNRTAIDRSQRGD